MAKDLCIEIIEKCLNNCQFCSSNSNCQKEYIIDFITFKRVIDHFMKNGVIEELSLSGGEPFLHPELLKIVEYAKSYSIKTVIFTSGVIEASDISDIDRKIYAEEMIKKLEEVDKNEPDNAFLKGKIKNYYTNILKRKYSSIPREMLEQLKNIGLDKIVFDYQAYEAERDNIVMGRCEEARQSFLNSLITASLVGLNVDVHFIPMKVNYQEIGDILELLEIANVGSISILNFIPQGRGRINKDKLQLFNEELNEFFELLNKYRKKFSGKIRVGIPLQEENLHKCNAGLEKLDIKFDGTVLPCQTFKEITEEDCQKYNIALASIYTNLEDVIISGTGTRRKTLCKQFYNFKN
ncbi:MAG: radical SAM protein [Bacilli bacterium]|nr:radical SAM protein [Bacilli bacterium]